MPTCFVRMKTRCHWGLAALLVGFTLWASPGAIAQEVAAQEPAGEVAAALTAAKVQQRLDALLANTQVAEETRESAKAYYQTALQRLDVQSASVDAEQRYRQAVADAEATLAGLGRELWEAAGSPIPGLIPASGVPMAELEQGLAAAQGQASSLRSSLGELDAQLQTMAGRAVPLREELASEHQKLADLAREQEEVPADEETAVLRMARAGR